MMQQLVVSEPTAALRRILLPRVVSDADFTTPMLGLSWSANEIKLSKNGAAEVNSAGTVVEMGSSGYYYYEAAAAELDTKGFLAVRLAKFTVMIDTAIVQVGLLNYSIPELSQGIPSATPALMDAIMALYMALRNRLDVDASEKRIYNDAGTCIFVKSLNDDGVTFTEAEAQSGP